MKKNNRYTEEEIKIIIANKVNEFENNINVAGVTFNTLLVVAACSCGENAVFDTLDCFTCY
jgi:hypothetical protein